ncbi:hypothetical protein CN090_14625 [Sinorhizobium meliloti]|nr:hypothetical protein CN108_25205 [Sinorhizobium meliloti]RVN69155.1 hypothetical protein CN104_05270 [Sinorhizobium meliloti]RVO20536.1 hypothetical protein CN100_21745 [Sinorhizobium meliloti]RVO50256.1 hypothetical protein CN090_14625 [Sinorhizobium meliloti]
MMSLARRDLPLTLYAGKPLTLYSRKPLTLTLSPQAGRGDSPCAAAAVAQDGAAYPFSPRAGRRWRQPDEGRTAETAIAPNAIFQEAR